MLRSLRITVVVGLSLLGLLVFLLVITTSEIDDQVAGFNEEALAVGVRCKRRAVAGQRQAERFRQAVHGVCGKHAGA